MATRTYGTGSLALRKTKRHPEGEYWLRYRDAAGRQRTENSHFCLCHDGRALTSAERLLAKRMGEVQTGSLPSPKVNRTLVADLADALFANQRAESLRKIPENLPAPTREWRAQRVEKILSATRGRWNKHVAPVFGDRKASLVIAQDLTAYQTKRLEAGARYATINRELQLLRRAYRLGFESRPRLVQDVPAFPKKLAESPRTGFIEDEAFAKLLAAFAEPGLKALVLVAFRLGFRKSELQNLLVLQYSDGWLRLFKGATKNGRARVVAVPDDVNEALVECAKGKAPDQHLFTWSDGSQILDFRIAWKKACKAAGVPKLRVHDLRRSAVRRMRKRGVPVATGMQITGHLTRQIFDDYDQASPEDLAEAAKLL
jgi:integrase